MYVRNAWYVACTAEEIGHGKPLGRTLCGERMVLFRAEGGTASALGKRLRIQFEPPGRRR